MTTATAPVSLQRKRYFTRGRIFGIVYLVFAALLVYWAFTSIEAGLVSQMGIGVIGKPPPVRIPFPSRITIITIALFMAVSGVYSLASTVPEKAINYLLAFNFLALVFGVIIGLSADRGMDLVGLVKDSVRLATPIVLGAIAGVLCERAGVVNIAIEGMMLAAACLGFTISLYTQNMWVGLLGAMITGGLMAALHAWLSIRFMVDQIISGTVINILAVGITGYVRKAFLLSNPFGAPGTLPYVFKNTPLWDIPIIGTLLFQYQVVVYITMILIPVVTFVLFRTRWGLRTRAVGEHPKAADTLGVNVFFVRYVNVIAAGCIAGIGGAWFSLETVGSFDDLMTNGKGFIALAAMIFGNWNPIGATIGAWLFGFADALAFKLQILELPIPYQFINMAPYILTMIALAGVIGKTIPPVADGVPYEKE